MQIPAAPSENPSGTPAPAPAAAQRPAWPPPSWLVHDFVVYAGAYLSLYAADTAFGGGWDAMFAAIPVAASQLLRQFASKIVSKP